MDKTRSHRLLRNVRRSRLKTIALLPSMITLTNNIYPVVVIIDSQAIASTQQILFDTLWELL